MLTVRIDTGNAAFQDDPGELARLLTELAGLFNSGLPDEKCCGRVRDSYGNLVGRWIYEAKETLPMG